MAGMAGPYRTEAQLEAAFVVESSTRGISREKIQEILEAGKARHPFCRIAHRQGISRWQVTRCLQLAGIPLVLEKPQITSSIAKQMVQDHQYGLSISRIARKNGVSPGSVRRHLVRQGETLKSQRIPPGRRISWAEMYQAGSSLQKIAEEHEISHRTVAVHLRRLGVQLRPRGGQRKPGS